MKKLLLGLMVSVLLAMPAYGQEVNRDGRIGIEAVNEKIVKTVLKEYKGACGSFTGARTKYTAAGAAVRKAPAPGSEVIGTSQRNTEVEMVGEWNGWAIITSEDGYAYLESACISDVPLPVPAYTDEDLYVLAHILAGECQTYPDQEQLYVGSVVLNRVKSGKYPDTVRGVAFQRGQYACTWDGNYYRTPTERNWANARWLLENGSVLPDRVVYQSGKRQGSGVHVKTRYHYYCYE